MAESVQHLSTLVDWAIGASSARHLEKYKSHLVLAPFYYYGSSKSVLWFVEVRTEQQRPTRGAIQSHLALAPVAGTATKVRHCS